MNLGLTYILLCVKETKEDLLCTTGNSAHYSVKGAILHDLE